MCKRVIGIEEDDIVEDEYDGALFHRACWNEWNDQRGTRKMNLCLNCGKRLDELQEYGYCSKYCRWKIEK